MESDIPISLLGQVPFTKLATVLPDASVSLVLLFGSWTFKNRVDLKTNYLTLGHIFQQALESFQQQYSIQGIKNGQIGAIQVDENEDTLHRLCDLVDFSESNSFIVRSILQAPSELPALVLHKSSQSTQFLSPSDGWFYIPIDSMVLQTALSFPLKSLNSTSLSLPGSTSVRIKSITHRAQLQDAILNCLIETFYTNHDTERIFTHQRLLNRNAAALDPLCSSRDFQNPPNKPQPVQTSEFSASFHPPSSLDTKSSSKIYREPHLPYHTISHTQPPLRIFVAGDKTQVGKSTICLGLLGSLLKLHFHPRDLAYIKPATQCEASTLVSQFCAYHGIDAVSIGPVVYYKGFTRSFLLGQVEDTSSTLLDKISQITDALAYGTYKSNASTNCVIHDVIIGASPSFRLQRKKVVIIDGVGYPAVGSVCGTDNADVARACGYPSLKNDGAVLIDKPHPTFETRRPAPVLLVGKSGIGDAIDSYNLNASYFSSKHVPVMGAIFNRISMDPNHYYNMERCSETIRIYFQRFKDHEQVFGYLPELESGSLPINLDAENMNTSMTQIDTFISLFLSHVDVPAILQSAEAMSRSDHDSNLSHIDSDLKVRPQKDPITSSHASSHTFLSRDEVEASAQKLGAASG